MRPTAVLFSLCFHQFGKCVLRSIRTLTTYALRRSSFLRTNDAPRKPQEVHAEIRADEKNRENRVGDGRPEDIALHLTHQVQNQNRHRVDKLFQDRNRNDLSEAQGLERDQNEHALPQERHAHKSVVNLWMAYCGRGFLADRVHKEIQRNQQNESVNRGDPENSLREFHCVLTPRPNLLCEQRVLSCSVSLLVSMNEVSGERGQAHRDILRAIRAWSAVVKPIRLWAPR